MDDLNRRAALVGATGAGLLALIGSHQPAHAAEPAAATERFVVGPYNLGEWLEKSTLQFDSKLFVKLGAAAREAMVKSLRECLVYVIDRRVRPKDEPVRFAETDPHIAFTGPLHHEWKDGKKQLVVQIASATTHGQEIRNKKPTPTRKFSVTVALRTAEEDEKNKTSGVKLFSAEPITYDINGVMV